MAGDSEWQEVRRRRRFPDNWRTPTNDKIDQVRPYKPYKAARSYAQVLRGNLSNSSRGSASSNSAKTSLVTSRPTSPTYPTSSTSPKYYYSPHSPTKLRLPPLPTYSEWWGRCFDCYRVGHTSAKCHNPKRCGKCWETGHMGRFCMASNLNLAAPPFQPTTQEVKPKLTEPLFDELLVGTLPPTPDMPEGRPDKILCFIERDEDFYSEVKRLERAVVLNGEHGRFALEVHQVVDIAVDTGLVCETEIRVAQLSQGKFLIHLPQGLAVDTFVKATPSALWDEGFSFEHWSQTHNANIIVPRFKVLIDLVGVAMHIWDEKIVSKAVSKFGLFLGTVAPEHETNYRAWRVVVATDDLTRIPLNIGLIAGVIEHPVHIRPVKWEKGAIYEAADFPKAPPRLSRPPSPPPSTPSSPEDFLNLMPTRHDESELIACSRRVLFELCNGVDPAFIPPEVMAVLASAKNMGKITMDSLRELMYATDNHRLTNPPETSQEQPTMQPTTDLETQETHTTVDPMVKGMDSDPPGDNRLSRGENDKGQDTSRAPGTSSVQGTVPDTPNREKTLLEIDEGIFRDSQGYGEGESSQPKTSTDTQQPQLIWPRRKPSQPLARHVGRGIPLQPFNTSRHIRFRGMIGRGRGRVGPHANATTRNFPGTSRSEQAKRINQWILTEEVPHRIIPTLVSQEDNSTKIEAPAATFLSSHVTSDATINGQLGQTSEEARQAHKRKTEDNNNGLEAKRPIQPTRIQASVYAQLNLNPEEHFQASINKDLEQQISKACGVKPNDISQLLAKDNAERQQNFDASISINEPTEEERRQSEERFLIEIDEESESEQGC